MLHGQQFVLGAVAERRNSDRATKLQWQNSRKNGIAPPAACGTASHCGATGGTVAAVRGTTIILETSDKQ